MHISYNNLPSDISLQEDPSGKADCYSGSGAGSLTQPLLHASALDPIFVPLTMSTSDQQDAVVIARQLF